MLARTLALALTPAHTHTRTRPRSCREVEFLDTTFEALGGLLSKRVAFPPGRVGTWRLTYVDGDTRVLYAKGGSAKEENVFVMRRVES